MHESKVSGFSLGGWSYGEGDHLTVFFTREAGKIRAAVKGSRSKPSKLRVLSELFNESELVLSRRAGSDIHRLTQGRLMDARLPLKANLASLSALQVLADILRSGLPDAEPQEELYEALTGTLGRIALHPGRPEAALTAFILRFLDLGGYPLRLGECALCGQDARGKGRLSALRGGWVCAECGAPPAEGPETEDAVRSLLEKLRGEKTGLLRRGADLPLSDAFRAAALYLSHALETELPTVDFYLKTVSLTRSTGPSAAH